MPEPTSTPKTKICDACDASIGQDEAKCPKCGIDFAELEDSVAAVTLAQTVAQKRYKREHPEPESEKKVTPVSKLRGLGRALREKK